MNKQEFEEMKQEFAKEVYRYEHFVKESHILDFAYVGRFQKLLSELNNLLLENQLIAKALELKSEGKEMTDINEMIVKFKQDYQANMVNISRRDKDALMTLEKNLAYIKNNGSELEEIYQNYCNNYHPAVKAYINRGEDQLYQQLKSFYYEDNLLGFNEFFELNKNIISTREITEDLYNNISGHYYKLRTNMGSDYAKRKNAYPFNKKHVFENDMTIAQEEAELRVQNRKLLERNEQLKNAFKNAFDYVLTLN